MARIQIPRFIFWTARYQLFFALFDHIAIVILAIATVCLTLSLAGCSSTSVGIPYLGAFTLRYSTPESSRIEVRVGYFGSCYILNNDSLTLCASSASTYMSNNVENLAQDPLNLVGHGTAVKDKVLFPYTYVIVLALMFISIVLLFTFPSWHEEVGDDGSTQDVKQLPPPIVLTILNGLALPTSVCALLATTLAHSALMGYAAALRITVPTEVEAQLGVANLVLSWAGSLLCALAFTVIFVQDLSIKVLRETISSEDLAAQTPSAAQVRFDDLDE